MKDKDEKYVRFLDRIIDRYSATPSRDPEIVDYASRPDRETIKEIQIARVSWGPSRYKSAKSGGGKTRSA